MVLVLLSRRFMRSVFSTFVRTILLVIAAWTLIALLFATQGYAIARFRGSTQPWWPSLGYALAIFSIWVGLTPVVFSGTRWAGRLTPIGRLSAFVAGLPIVVALHVALFALLYWPVYNDGGRIATRRAMAERMAIRNLDTNALFYFLVIGVALRREGSGRRAAASAVLEPTQPENAPLRVRSRGRLLFIAPATLDWAAAADDYVELHVGEKTHLIDGSLAALERLLPDGEFARVHRGIVVQIDRVAELRSLGRGDAMVRLTTGAELRLSRRYRSNLTLLLHADRKGNPACPSVESRLPNETGEAVRRG